ncbi:Ger(x)C family spore germination protein [Paenibacillus antri]|uniref:Ger(X)C family spore germination protein n=1 Tax=Paenibacillus antri TaxID=2582848 RepID=A0A5R9G2E0_9BACL|nr:Ger(x)C family spore germination protein [Paenibacillus antri]TLS48320.1 Ger(x)C family spore germination protein [Paenibacillus antri]
MRTLVTAILSVSALLLLTGCWDRLEIEERAVVLSIAIDAADPEVVEKESMVNSKNRKSEHSIPVPEGKTVRVTAQIAVPGRIPLGPGGSSGSGGSSGGGNPVWVLESYGYTIDEALQSMQQEVADRMFFGHLRVIVMSEEYARRGTGNLSDYLRRNPEVRRLAWLVVSKEEAAQYMRTAPQLERVPALYLLSTMDHAVQMGKYPMEPIGSFWIKMSSLGQEANLPYLELQEKNNVRLSGLAYFKGEKLVGVTQPLEVGLFMGLSGSEQGGYSSYVRIPDSEETAMFRVSNRRSKTRAYIKNGRPAVEVTVFLEGNLTEASDQGKGNLNTQEDLQKIGKDLSDRFSDRYVTFIRYMQKKESDIFGYGEYIRAHEPAYWNRHIRTKARWQSAFKDMDVKVNVTFDIRRVGQKAQ